MKIIVDLSPETIRKLEDQVRADRASLSGVMDVSAIDIGWEIEQMVSPGKVVGLNPDRPHTERVFAEQW